MEQERTWWKEAVVYQIYPRSFYDADGDGVGDLQGVVEKLDYVADLGVDVIWLNPVYESPQRDNGYDISDYRAIDDTFGDMDTWRRLLEEVHDRDMRLVMDLVVNHTSVDHEWFQRSRRGDPEYEDFYHWRSGEDGEAPNNWESFFGGSAWEHDEERGEQYLHLYDTSQPDLNWENEAVREAVYDVVDWWFQQGIDGFRMDVINLLSKTEGLPDGDPDGEWVGAEHFVDGPKLLDYLVELEERVLSNYDAMTVGEMPQLNLDYGPEGRWSVGDWDLSELKAITDRWQTELAEDGWNALYWENHDQPRVVSRYGDPERYHRESATMLATFVLTLQGTPFVYQGQELGMTNAPFPSIEDLRDVDAVNHALELMDERDCGYEEVRPTVEYRTRDNARTPMQWSDDEHAGFTDGDPWIDVNPNYEELNVERERADPDSVLSYYRELIELRQENPTLIYGSFEDLLPDHEQVYAYERVRGDDRIVVVLNTDGSNATVELSEIGDVDPLLANYDDPPTRLDDATVRPHEAAVYRV